MDFYEEGKRLLNLGKLEESCQVFTDFIQRYGHSGEHGAAVTDAYNSLGHIKYLSVDFPGAISDYTRAIERDPTFTIAWYNRGQVQYRLGRYRAAEKDLTRALGLDPQFRDAQLNLEQVQRDLTTGHGFDTHECDTE